MAATVSKRKEQEVTDTVIETLSSLGLTAKQQDFVLYYLDSGNVRQSYLKAFPHTDKKLASVYGSKMLDKDSIKSAMVKMRKILAKTYDINAGQYVNHLIEVANADIGDYIQFSEDEIPELDEAGNQKFNADTGEPVVRKVNKMHLTNSSSVDTKSIVSIKQGKDGISIQLADKDKAWEKLAKFFHWGEEKQDETKAENNIISAINNKAGEVWEQEDDNSDLEEALKDN